MLPGRMPEPEPEPRVPAGRLPPLNGGGQKAGAALTMSSAHATNMEELSKKKLSELCKLARAKDVDQYKIDEAVHAADPKQAILSLLSGHRSATAHAADAGDALHAATDECGGPLPDGQRELQVLCCTWNLKGCLPDGSLTPLLPTGYDIYAVATQESCASIQKSLLWSSKKAWEDVVCTHLSSGYEMVCAETLGATHLMVLVRKSVMKAAGGGVKCVRSATLATGVGNVVGNKGGVGICMRICGTSVLFVSSHFAADQNKVKERNADFQRINEELRLNCDVPSTHAPGTALSDRFDMVFWLGDLNYRIDGNRKAVEKLIHNGAEAALRNNDQLLNERARGNVFKGFREGKIRFKPTYKYDPGTDTYDTSKKQRIPAWTDRILYKPLNDEVRKRLRLCNYDSQNSLSCSDHKPVFALFKMRVFKSKDPDDGAADSVPRGASSSLCSIQ